MMHTPVRSAALLLLVGCAAGKEAAETAPRWRLTDQPLFDVGVAQGEEPYELEGAASSLRLADGRVLIANTGSHEIRVFDPQGHFVARIGRKGSGPGEFDGAIQLAMAASNGFTAFDRGQDRLSTFDSAGNYLDARRVEGPGTFTSFPLWVWLYRANWIVGPADSSGRPEIAKGLSSMGDPPAGAYRYVQVASDGRIWSQVRLPGDSAEAWQVHAPDGALVAIADLPQPFEIHQIGSDFVLGRHWDANDVEHIQLYGVAPDTTMIAVPGAPTHDSTSLSSLSDPLKVSLRNLVMAQEMFYADNNRYATQTGTLKWETGGGILHLMEADRRGWVGVLVHEKGPVICGMAVGNSTPPGWGEGSPKCGS